MGAKQLAAVEHIIVLMLENRSFDHRLGFCTRTWAITRRLGIPSRDSAARSQTRTLMAPR